MNQNAVGKKCRKFGVSLDVVSFFARECSPFELVYGAVPWKKFHIIHTSAKGITRDNPAFLLGEEVNERFSSIGWIIS